MFSEEQLIEAYQAGLEEAMLEKSASMPSKKNNNRTTHKTTNNYIDNKF